MRVILNEGELPPEFDWSDRGGVVSKDTDYTWGRLHSDAWAFSAVEAVQSHLLIRTG